MNRLIIIGNGFDLAHGLKTSFKDFINDYFANTVFPELDGKHRFQDQLLKVEIGDKRSRSFDVSLYDDEPLDLFLNHSKEFNWHVQYLGLFKAIMKKAASLRWVDIEHEYFNQLHILSKKFDLLKPFQGRDATDEYISRNMQVKLINEQLEFIESLLISYLESQNNLFKLNNISQNEHMQEIETKMFKGHNMKTFGELKEVLILNFNYTDTSELYSNYESQSVLVKTIHIHGKLGTGHLVFGFGDDTTDNYRAIEDLNDNEFLKKIKSFKYSDTNSYSDLIQFISDNDFEAHIFGHSCGISDRTLLKQIFENKYCQRIIVHPYNKEDFDQKKYEISRHFSNNTDFLNKLIPFPKLEPMPQPMLFENVAVGHSLNGNV